MMLNVVMNE